MTLRFLHIPLHCEPEEAHTLFAFLDHLREALLDLYGEQIQEHQRTACYTRHIDGQIDFIEQGDI